MDIMTTFSAAMAGGKAAYDILQAITGVKIDNAAMAKIHDALSEVMTLNGNLFQTQQYLFELHRQNEELHQQIKTHDDFAARKAQYKLCKTVGGANVYQSIEIERQHYVCPSCLDEHKEFDPLQDLGLCQAPLNVPSANIPIS